jgi:hypothetical protein
LLAFGDTWNFASSETEPQIQSASSEIPLALFVRHLIFVSEPLSSKKKKKKRKKVKTNNKYKKQLPKQWLL